MFLRSAFSEEESNISYSYAVVFISVFKRVVTLPYIHIEKRDLLGLSYSD